MEQVAAEYTVTGNILEIIPEDIQDNSQYQIKISGIQSVDGTRIYPDQIFTVTTAVTPMYCTLASLKAVTSNFGIPDEDMIMYIRDASKFADFVASALTNTTSNTAFAKQEFTKVKATLDCLVRGFMISAKQGGNKYKLGEDELTEGDHATAFKNLLDALRLALKYWEDAIRGYFNEGRAKPKVTRIGIKASENTDVAHITVDQILDDWTRSAPQWS